MKLKIASKIGLLLLALSSIAKANQAFLVKCDISGQFVVTSGLNSTNKFEQTFPGCTVTVFIHSSATLATIFSDNIGTPLANPFTTPASGLTPGQQLVYANNGRYDFVISGAGISSPVTISDVLLNDSVAQLSSTPCPLTFSSTPVFTAGTCSIFSMTLTGNVASSTITGGITGQIIVISLTQGAGGPWTFQFPSAFLNPPILTPTAGNGEQFSFVLLNDGKWHNVSIGEFPVNQFTNITGTGGSVVLSNSPSITGTDNGVETQNNKTLGSPVITGTASGAATIPPTMLNSTTGTGAAVLATSPSISSPTSTGTDNGAEAFVNKILDTAAPNTFKIGGVAITATTGSGAAVLATSPTITTPSISSPTTTGTDAGVETLNSKTLGSPAFTGTASGAATIPPTMLNSTTGTGAAVLTNSPALVSPTTTGTDNGAETFANKTHNVPLNNGTALQIINTTTTCTTGASVGATCTTANITIPVTEPDTAYRVVCTGKGTVNIAVVIQVTNVDTSHFTISIAALTAAAASFTSYDCILFHS